MRRVFFLLSLACVPIAGRAEEGKCFFTHLRDAMAVNEARRPLYSAMTGGRSEEATDKLLQMEHLGLLPARFLDWWARGFQKRGLRVMCDEFVPMTEAPRFGERRARPTHGFTPDDGRAIRHALDSAWRAGGWDALRVEAKKWISSFDAEPAHHCLMRHFLESIVRTARLAPEHGLAARARGIGDSPEGISRLFTEVQLASLPMAAGIDRVAAPLQAEGVPIVCQDVPRIPE